MTAVVVDSSAVVEWVLRTRVAPDLDRYFSGLDCVAPELIDAEVVHTLRRRERLGLITAERGVVGIRRLVTAPIQRFPHLGLVAAAWSMRHNVTAYDAMYVALARALRCPFVTTDRKLASAPNLGITVTVIA